VTICDHRRLCVSFKDCDEIAGWIHTDTTFAGATARLPADTEVMVAPEGTFLDGRLLTPNERLTPIVKAGDEIRQYAVCYRRDGHRGEHGFSPYRHPLYALRRLWRRHKTRRGHARWAKVYG